MIMKDILMIYQINRLKKKQYKFDGHLLYVLHWLKEWMTMSTR